jgi:hypothetical protein
VKISILYFDGCPNWVVALVRLSAALRLQGLDEPIYLRRVDSAEEADLLRFRGSPTILIDGEDPFHDETAPVGLACRMYRTDRGMEGSPSVEQLRAALAERREARTPGWRRIRTHGGMRPAPGEQPLGAGEGLH